MQPACVRVEGARKDDSAWISFQLSAFSYQLFAISYQLRSTKARHDHRGGVLSVPNRITKGWSRKS
jgi:hypothetical protein